MDKQASIPLRHDWAQDEVETLFALPFNELLFSAQTAHRRYFDPNVVQTCTLLSIKTGACPEDCQYCSQSSRYNTGLKPEPLMDIDTVVAQAKAAKKAGATRLCMGAAWRTPKKRDMPAVIAMIKAVKALGLESCVTLGMLSDEQTQQLADAGLDYYNHNLDTSPDFYPNIISTRCYQDRLDTLEKVREAGIHVCSGGIIGLGENVADRAALLRQLANLSKHPSSVPINNLVHVEGTPLAKQEPLDPLAFIRTIAVAKLVMPRSTIRLSAGRESMSDELQALAYFAGASSVFYGETLLTTANPTMTHDQQLFNRLGLQVQAQTKHAAADATVSQATDPHPAYADATAYDQ